MEFLLIALIVFLSVFLIWNIADTFRKQDEKILSYQNALVNAYTEIEMMKAGLLK